ncbi:hypothetical protein P154DRAFT_577151 [Amniculicola lignicola CBS 123094]|uniref:Uncharacterized protein n=1 Tax=Amniculicola lignicola CBS 123094 TaxID=1392246 RepID=A0A6A5WE88_9PLEO|nr:hypothetical protein P154DRAFT_577151 [Amniculicola lignicola CBS 123094]
MNSSNVTTSPSFRCKGKSYPCAQENPFDPDIAGIGVVVSILASAFFTLAAIVFGYFKRILPGVSLGRADEVFLSDIHRTKAQQDRLEDALEKFVLSLSDQQLVTGLAILIAGFQKCDISSYSQSTVAALAWFSCTTHLATIAVLQRYLRCYAWLRHLRVFGMLLIASLISPSLILTSLTGPVDSSFYCHVRNITFDKRKGFLELMQMIFIIIYLIYAYFKRLMPLYLSPIPTGDRRRLAMAQKHNQAVAGWRRTRSIPENTTRVSAYRMAVLVFIEFNASFISTIASILFMGAYGLTRTILIWSSHSIELEMGLGQMVPLILLVLPVFALIETLSEVREEHRSADGQGLETSHPELQLPANPSHRVSPPLPTQAPTGDQIELVPSHITSSNKPPGIEDEPAENRVDDLMQNIYNKPTFRRWIIFTSIFMLVLALGTGAGCGGAFTQTLWLQFAFTSVLYFFVVSAIAFRGKPLGREVVRLFGQWIFSLATGRKAVGRFRGNASAARA